VDLYPPQKAAGKEDGSKPSFLRRNWRRARYIAGGPIATIGLEEISGGARLIDKLFGLVRGGPQADERLKVNVDGTIDLVATAFCFGVSSEEFAKRICARREQTVRAAYTTFALGCLSLLLWLYGVVQVRMGSGRILSAIEFLPFCVLFFLLSFKSAWMNWQLRTLRMGSAVAYLKTTEPFLPQ
jgi:hypothetical protein